VDARIEAHDAGAFAMAIADALDVVGNLAGVMSRIVGVG
jgi:hypothetical protein